MATARTQRLTQYQNLINAAQNSAPYDDNEPASHLIKEGYLRFEDNAKDKVRATFNGYKDMNRLVAAGYLTGTPVSP